MSHSVLVCLETRLVAVRSLAKLHIKEIISQTRQEVEEKNIN